MLFAEARIPNFWKKKPKTQAENEKPPAGQVRTSGKGSAKRIFRSPQSKRDQLGLKSPTLLSLEFANTNGQNRQMAG